MLVWPGAGFRSGSAAAAPSPSQQQQQPPRIIMQQSPSSQSSVRFDDEYLVMNDELQEGDVSVALQSTSFRSIAAVTLTPNAASLGDAFIAKLRVKSTQPLLLTMVTNAKNSDETVVDAADHFFVVLGTRGEEEGDDIGADETLVVLYAKANDGDFLFSHLQDSSSFTFNVIAAAS